MRKIITLPPQLKRGDSGYLVSSLATHIDLPVFDMDRHSQYLTRYSFPRKLKKATHVTPQISKSHPSSQRIEKRMRQ